MQRSIRQKRGNSYKELHQTILKVVTTQSPIPRLKPRENTGIQLRVRREMYGFL